MTRRTGPRVIRRAPLSNGVHAEWRSVMAYHEAGHAAMYFFFGQLGDLCHIDMVPSGDTDACVVTRNVSMFWLCSDSSVPMGLRKLNATKIIMQKLAGPCAQNRVTRRDTEWFRCPMLRRDWKGGEQPDFAQATEAAKFVYDDADQANQFAEQIATWTEQALIIPRLWAVVEALAKQLESVDLLEAVDALATMTTAWGDGDIPPSMHVGPDWRKRLSIREEGLNV